MWTYVRLEEIFTHLDALFVASLKIQRSDTNEIRICELGLFGSRSSGLDLGGVKCHGFHVELKELRARVFWMSIFSSTVLIESQSVETSKNWSLLEVMTL